MIILQIREGLHYNPYFPGGAIAMPKMLNDEAVEYEDGVPATEAQVMSALNGQPCLLSVMILTLSFVDYCADG